MCNQFVLADDQFGAIMNSDEEEISGLEGPILSLEEFESVNFYLSSEMKYYYNFSNKNYFIIALLQFNHYLLIGCNDGNWNKIYLSIPEENKIIELANNFKFFINEVVQIVD